MKAVVYNGPRSVEVKEMPDPKIQHPNDVIVRITTTNICGSDLHMYEGRTELEPGKIIAGRETGASVINDSKEDPVERVLELTAGEGARQGEALTHRVASALAGTSPRRIPGAH